MAGNVTNPADAREAAAGGRRVAAILVGPGVGREGRLLEALALASRSPCTRPRFADEDAGVLAYERIPGGRCWDASRRPARPRDPHAVDPATVAGLVPVEDADPAEWLDGLDVPSCARRRRLRQACGSSPTPTWARSTSSSSTGR